MLRQVWETADATPSPSRWSRTPWSPSPGKLAHYADLGVKEAVLQLPSAPRDEVMRTPDDFAQYL